MKRIFAFLLLLLYPTFVLADWVGAVDNRRYVSESEKSEYPYNTIVRIDTGDGISTGTLVAPNVILTCGHCVSYVGLNNSIRFYTPDGHVHNGTVWHYKDGANISKDYALVVSNDLIPGPFLNVVRETVMEPNAMRAGYDSLKVLSNEEIRIVQNTFADVLSKYTVTYDNFDKIMDEIESELQKKDCSKISDKTKCVSCLGDDSCIFGDYENLKVQNSCSVNNILSVDSGGKFLLTNCALSFGGSGSPLIDSGRKSIIGISVGTRGVSIGNASNAVSYAVQPEEYQESTRSLINMSINGLIEY